MGVAPVPHGVRRETRLRRAVSILLWSRPRNPDRVKWRPPPPHQILRAVGFVVDAFAPMASEDTSKRMGPTGPKKKIEVMDPRPSP